MWRPSNYNQQGCLKVKDKTFNGEKFPFISNFIFYLNNFINKNKNRNKIKLV